MGLLDLGTDTIPPGSTDTSLPFGKLPADAMQVIKTAGEKARVLMTRLEQLFDQKAVDGSEFCMICKEPVYRHLGSCAWERAKDAYQDVVKHAGQFMQ